MLENERVVPPDVLPGSEPYFKILALSLSGMSVKDSNLILRANGTVHFASCLVSFATMSKLPLWAETPLEMLRWLQKKLQAPLLITIAGMKSEEISTRFHMQIKSKPSITRFQYIFQTELSICDYGLPILPAPVF